MSPSGRRRAFALVAALTVATPLAVGGVGRALTGDPGGNRPAVSQVRANGSPDAAQGVLNAQLVPGEDPTYPGLPKARAGWSGTATAGLGYVTRSKQYLQVPTIVNPIDVALVNYGSPGTPPIPAGFQSATEFNFNGHVKSPVGAPHAYGDYPPFRTLLLAFGALPVEATLYITQLRDANDLPVPLKLRTLSATAKTTGYRLSGDGTLVGQVQLRIADLTVDGVRVEVGDHCQASGPSSLTATGLGFWQGNIGGTTKYWKTDGDKIVGPTPGTMLTAQQAQKDRYSLFFGGPLTGTLTVPPFVGCTGPSGDLSAIVNSAVAGDQPTTIVQGAAQQCFGAAVQCNLPQPIPYPTAAP